MKRIIYTAIFLSASWLTGCQEAEYLLFNDIARVQMDEEDEIRTSFYYTDASINRDTVYLTVNTIGDPEDQVRHIAMEQISEYDVEYKYDEKGNDTATTEIYTLSLHDALPISTLNTSMTKKVISSTPF